MSVARVSGRVDVTGRLAELFDSSGNLRAVAPSLLGLDLSVPVGTEIEITLAQMAAFVYRVKFGEPCPGCLCSCHEGVTDAQLVAVRRALKKIRAGWVE